jgi:hypothetical protein
MTTDIRVYEKPKGPIQGLRMDYGGSIHEPVVEKT